jgi:hypothetical protein
MSGFLNALKGGAKGVVGAAKSIVDAKRLNLAQEKLASYRRYANFLPTEIAGNIPSEAETDLTLISDFCKKNNQVLLEAQDLRTRVVALHKKIDPIREIFVHLPASYQAPTVPEKDVVDEAALTEFVDAAKTTKAIEVAKLYRRKAEADPKLAEIRSTFADPFNEIEVRAEEFFQELGVSPAALIDNYKRKGTSGSNLAASMVARGSTSAIFGAMAIADGIKEGSHNADLLNGARDVVVSVSVGDIPTEHREIIFLAQSFAALGELPKADSIATLMKYAFPKMGMKSRLKDTPPVKVGRAAALNAMEGCAADWPNIRKRFSACLEKEELKDWFELDDGRVLELKQSMFDG